MLATLLMAAAAFTPQGPTGPSGVVINEFSNDDSGTDDFEFVEIYNAGSSIVDMTGWTLNGIDGTTSGNGTYTFPVGLMLNPGEFWVVGSPGVPNVDDGLGGLGLENGADGVWLEDGNFVVQDGVIWELADWTNPLPVWQEGGLWGAIQGHEHPTGTLDNAVGRAIDGVDTNDNACDFRPMPATPGELNILGTTTTLPYRNNFDDPVATTADADFMYSFLPGNVQDPNAVQVTTIGLPVTIPASPQGGNISVWHDPSGGGNANWLRNFSQADYVLESYVWVPGPNALFDADDGESWVIGVRGHSDSFGEFTDIGGFRSLISCGSGSTIQTGHTGIAWYHHRTASLSDLYLVDFNNGGDDPIILAGPINIVAGVNDGWQRVRLCVSGTGVVGNFGGTYGCDDGDRYTASTNTVCANGVYVTYRECVTTNDSLTPLILDALVVADCQPATLSTVGTGSPNSGGIPTIAANSSPAIGNTGFTVDIGNLVAAPFAGLIIDPAPPLPGIPIPGAPAGALLYATPTLVLASVLPGTTASYLVPLPCDPTLVGAILSFQAFDWDSSLPNALPIGLSEGLIATLGF